MIWFTRSLDHLTTDEAFSLSTTFWGLRSDAIVADSTLFQKGIAVIPDILANAGGVTVSYFEQVQNNANYFWSRTEVQEKLKSKMETAFIGVLGSATKHCVMLRTGAYIVAMERILEAMKMRGE